MRFNFSCYCFFIILFSCTHPVSTVNITAAKTDTAKKLADSVDHINSISTGNVTSAQLISFARTLEGIPYKYGSTDPAKGFDCSGFITYVFNHFGIGVPRSSVDFTFMQRAISLKDVKPGDLILFTGTDRTIRTVGHMGIIIKAGNTDSITFIHSTSGKAWGVTETPLNAYYMGRYMKTIRVFSRHN
jgi:lipoprotein Spr